jgi:hypothetical protein
VKKLEIEVRGKEKTWGFMFDGDPKHLAEWRADGLEVNEIFNIIPEWVVDIGMTNPWCFVQDILYGTWWSNWRSKKPKL